MYAPFGAATMRISFLSNSLLAFPTVQFLMERGHLAGLAAPARNPVVCEQFDRLAAEAGIPFVPVRKSDLEAELLGWIDASRADAVVVQTFPYKIPAACLERPRFGFFNLHPGPLPAYRGPDPVFWQLARNEAAGALTLHRMDAEYDTGPIVHVEPVPLLDTDTYGHVQSNLAAAAPRALAILIDALCRGVQLPATPQPADGAAFHPTPSVEHLLIDWKRMPAAEICGLVRASNPGRNGAITFFRNVMMRILEVKPVPLEFPTKLPPGSVVAADASRGLQVMTSDGQALRLEVMYVEEGYYSGARFCEVFEVRLGEKLSLPACLS